MPKHTPTKIHIKKIDKQIFRQKGFPSTPFVSCLTCKCGDVKSGGACCNEGVYMDKETFNILFKQKKHLEKGVGIKFRNCFYKRWSNDSEYLGGNGLRTRNRNGTCIFKSRFNPGCEIVSLVLKKKLPRRAIPSACRLYPITWNKGRLFIEDIQKNCLCCDKRNKTKKSIYETQKKEIDDIILIHNTI